MGYEYHFPKRAGTSIEHWGAFATTIEIIAIERDDTATLPYAEQVASQLNTESPNGFDGGAVQAILGRRPIVEGAAATAYGVSDGSFLTVGVTRSVDVEPLPDARGFSIRINVTNYDFGNDPLVRVNVQVTATQQAVYRVGPAVDIVPNFGSECDTGITDARWRTSSNLQPACNPAQSTDANQQRFAREAGDIGGTAVDHNGVPMNTLRPRLQYDVEVIARGPYVDDQGAVVADSALVGNTNYFRDEVGRRNDAEFLGCECGTLLFTGVTRTRLDGEWSSMTLSFLWDEWKHAEQIPRRPYNTGDAGLLRASIKCDGSDADSREILHQFAVYWQCIYDVADFSGMFNSDITAYLNSAGYTIGT